MKTKVQFSEIQPLRLAAVGRMAFARKDFPYHQFCAAAESKRKNYWTRTEPELRTGKGLRPGFVIPEADFGLEAISA